MILEKAYKKEYLQTLNWQKLTLYSMYSLSILIPLIIGKPQLVVGSIVNFLIIYSSLKYGIRKSIPLLILPSLTATTTGLLFDGATYFLIYLTPFIIFSNLILSYFASKKSLSYLILGVLSKGIFLVLMYKLLIESIGLPNIFLTSSYLQFLTGLVGGIFAYTLFKLNKDI